jgi:hypothetical protein
MFHIVNNLPVFLYNPFLRVFLLFKFSFIIFSIVCFWLIGVSLLDTQVNKNILVSFSRDRSEPLICVYLCL